MAEGGGASSFSGGSAPAKLDGSVLLNFIQRNPQPGPSSLPRSHLSDEALLPYHDPAIAAIGPGFSFLPHNILSHAQSTEAPGFSSPSWVPSRFSPPGGQQFYPADHKRVGFRPSGLSPPNSVPSYNNLRRISSSSPQDGVFASNPVRDLAGRKVSGSRGQVERASLRPPPGFGKARPDGSADISRSVEGGAYSQIGSTVSKQQWRPHVRSEGKRPQNEEGSSTAFMLSQRSNWQNARVDERQDERQRTRRISENETLYRGMRNSYNVDREKHAHSVNPGAHIVINWNSLGEKDGGKSDNDLEDIDIDDQYLHITEDFHHVETGEDSSRIASCSEEDLLGKHLAEALSDISVCRKVARLTRNPRGKDVRSDMFRGHRVSSQRIRFRRRELQCRSDIDSLAPFFLSIFKSLVPTDDEMIKQKLLLLALKKLVNKEWPDAELHLYGSCANSFGVSNSDIDVCLEIKDDDLSKLDILLKLADIFESSNLQNVQALTRARVPIVKLKDPGTGISCDICVNNLLAVVNTKLLRDYAQIDERLRQLAFIVKHWAKSRLVNETYQGTLSSYAYVLMCIHFLQTRKPAILPCLQGVEATYKVIVDDTECAYFDQVGKLHQFGAQNKESLPQLLWAFFNYWAYRHDYTNDVISVRTGSIISKHVKDWTRRIGNDRHLICIEDPFEVSHDLGRVVDKFSIKILREEFERAADILQNDPIPSVTLFEPYIPKVKSQPRPL